MTTNFSARCVSLLGKSIVVIFLVHGVAEAQLSKEEAKAAAMIELLKERKDSSEREQIERAKTELRGQQTPSAKGGETGTLGAVALLFLIALIWFVIKRKSTALTLVPEAATPADVHRLKDQLIDLYSFHDTDLRSVRLFKAKKFLEHLEFFWQHKQPIPKTIIASIYRESKDQLEKYRVDMVNVIELEKSIIESQRKIVALREDSVAALKSQLASQESGNLSQEFLDEVGGGVSIDEVDHAVKELALARQELVELDRKLSDHFNLDGEASLQYLCDKMRESPHWH